MVKKKVAKVTIEGLARMVASGFNSVENKMATKADMDRQFKNLNDRLDSLEKDVEHVKNIVVMNHKHRMEKLESEMRELKSLIGMK